MAGVGWDRFPRPTAIRTAQLGKSLPTVTLPMQTRMSLIFIGCVSARRFDQMGVTVPSDLTSTAAPTRDQLRILSAARDTAEDPWGPYIREACGPSMECLSSGSAK